MRLNSIAILLVALLSVSTGCARSTRPGNLEKVQPLSNQPRAGNAYLVRGFLGIFSEGVDRLTRQINESGVRANVYQDDQWAALARRISDEYCGTSAAEPLVLVGHSYGADDAIRIARELDRWNVPVDLLVTLDPVTPPPIPKNVRHCVNIYQPNGVWDALPFFRGVAVRQEPDFAGRLDNLDIRGERRDLLDPKTDHFNIEKNPKVHEEVIGNILVTCPPRKAWLAWRGRNVPAAEARLAGSTRLESSKNPSLGPARQAGHRLGN